MSKEQSEKQTSKIQKRYWIPIVLVAIIVAFRLYLPTWLLNHSNQVLAELPGYSGSINDVDVALYRGAYTFHDMTLSIDGAGTDIPFLIIPKADISIQWSGLFRGRVVSEIYLTEPQITYVYEDHLNPNQVETELNDWTAALDDLVPIDINHLEIQQGKFGFVQLSADPDIDLYIDQFNLTANNLELIKQTELNLPSTLVANGITIGKGKIKIDAKADLIRNVPDLDLNASVENIDATALNDLSFHYAKVDFASGELNLFSELAIADGYLKGYFKPLLSNAELIDHSDGFFEKLWEGVVNVFKFILKNHKTDNLATRIPLEGDLNNVESSAWETFVNILSNAFVQAFQENIDQDININDAQQASDEDDEG